MPSVSVSGPIHRLRASRKNPCRICGRANLRCLNYEHGATLCMTTDAPDARRVDCGEVGVGFYHPSGQGGFVGRPAMAQKSPPVTSAMADISARHRTYQAILQRFPLSDTHRTHLLQARRLPESLLSGFGSLPDDLPLRKTRCIGLEAGHGVPGLFRHYDAWTVSGPAGLLIPCLTRDGLIQGFQIRSDEAAYGKYVWLSSGKFASGTASGTFYHYTHAATRWDVWVCEGALKATVAAALTDEAFIGLPGCHLADAQAMLAPFKYPPRLILAPDADYRVNEQVRRGWVNTLEKLLSLGCEVLIADWPPEAGKGIDDVLIQSGQLPRLLKPRAWMRQFAQG